MKLNEVKKLIATNAIAGVGIDQLKFDIPKKIERSKHDIKGNIVSDFQIGKYKVFSGDKIRKHYPELYYGNINTANLSKFAEDTGINKSEVAIISKQPSGKAFRFYVYVGDELYYISFDHRYSEVGRNFYEISYDKHGGGYAQTNTGVPDNVLSTVGTFAAWVATRKKRDVFFFSGITEDEKGTDQRVSIYYSMLKLNNIKNIYIKGDSLFFSVTPVNHPELEPVTKEHVKSLKGEPIKRSTKLGIKQLNNLISKADPGYEVDEREIIPYETFQQIKNFYETGKYKDEKLLRPQIDYLENQELKNEEANIRSVKSDKWYYIKSASDELSNYVYSNFDYNSVNEEDFEYKEMDGSFEPNIKATNLASLYGMTFDELVNYIKKNSTKEPGSEKGIYISTGIMKKNNAYTSIILEKASKHVESEMSIDDVIENSYMGSRNRIALKYFTDEVLKATNFKIENGEILIPVSMAKSCSFQTVKTYLKENKKLDLTNIDRENLKHLLPSVQMYLSPSEEDKLIKLIKENPDGDYWGSLRRSEIFKMIEEE